MPARKGLLRLISICPDRGHVASLLSQLCVVLILKLVRDMITT